MASTFPAGPYKQLQITETATAPWYIAPFDKNGVCTAPLTRKHLVEAVRTDKPSDVFLFSHGWNNDWDTASERYENFIGGFAKMRHDFALAPPQAYRPLLAGIFWPSTALVMPWERAPKFAGAPAAADDGAEAWRRELEEFAEQVEPAEREEFYRLAQGEHLNEADAARLAAIIAKAARKFEQSGQDTGGSASPVEAKDILENARSIPGGAQAAKKAGSFGFATGTAAGPQAAFGLSDLDPRKLVRVATVLQMKDRAARVGALGVGPLLADILAAHPATRVHLIGHSYGGIVVLSATSVLKPPAKIESMLLLQPAVSQWCFAKDVAGRGFAGGYRPALSLVRKPILTTFSSKDVPLTKLFHFAARREQDLGQPKIAAGLPDAPSLYAALGGYGPKGLDNGELQVLELQSPPTPYAFSDPLPRVCALKGDRLIDGHGDISVPATWWALHQQL